MFLVVFLVASFYQAKIDGQNSRNQFLRNEIQILDVRIAEIKTLDEKKKALQKRINVIEQLQRSRNVGTQVLDEIAKIIPNGIYLTKLEKKGNIIHLTGKSESNNHLANMIREIELSDLFTDATPESIITDEEATKLFNDANAMIDDIIRNNKVIAKAVFGLFPAHRSGDDDIMVYADEVAQQCGLAGARQAEEHGCVDGVVVGMVGRGLCARPCRRSYRNTAQTAMSTMSMTSMMPYYVGRPPPSPLLCLTAALKAAHLGVTDVHPRPHPQSHTFQTIYK